MSTQQPYSVYPFAPDLAIIEERGVRMFLIRGESRAMLVDTGFGSGNLPALIRTLTDQPIFVVNTHADGDHIGANACFDLVFMHPGEMHRYYEKTSPSLCPQPLFDGDRIDLGSSCWEVIALPGHTPGSIALFERSRGLLIGGDTIQLGPIYMFGSGRCLPAMIASLERLQSMELPIRHILPSHFSLELPQDIIGQIIAAAQALLDGCLTPEAPERPLPCHRYQHGNISFYYGDRSL